MTRRLASRLTSLLSRRHSEATCPISQLTLSSLNPRHAYEAAGLERAVYPSNSGDAGTGISHSSAMSSAPRRLLRRVEHTTTPGSAAIHSAEDGNTSSLEQLFAELNIPREPPANVNTFNMADSVEKRWVRDCDVTQARRCVQVLARRLGHLRCVHRHAGRLENRT